MVGVSKGSGDYVGVNGQILVISSLVLMYGVGGFWFISEMFGDPEVPWFVKVGLPALVIGLTLLFGTALTQRLKAAKTDKYKDVED
jgi:hypothetical protein